MKFRNKALGISPYDPDYEEGYDPENDYERYCEEQEYKEQLKRENR